MAGGRFDFRGISKEELQEFEQRNLMEWEKSEREYALAAEKRETRRHCMKITFFLLLTAFNLATIVIHISAILGCRWWE